MGGSLEHHPFSGQVHSAGELLHTHYPDADFHGHRPACLDEPTPFVGSDERSTSTIHPLPPPPPQPEQRNSPSFLYRIAFKQIHKKKTHFFLFSLSFPSFFSTPMVKFADASGVDLVAYVCDSDTPKLQQVLSIMKQQARTKVSWELVPGLAVILGCAKPHMEGLAALSNLVDLPGEGQMASTKAVSVLKKEKEESKEAPATPIPEATTETPEVPETKEMPAEDTMQCGMGEAVVPTPPPAVAAAAPVAVDLKAEENTESATRISIQIEEWQEVRVAVLVGLRPLLMHCIASERALAARRGSRRLIKLAQDTQEAVMKHMRTIDADAPRAEEALLAEQRSYTKLTSPQRRSELHKPQGGPGVVRKQREAGRQHPTAPSRHRAGVVQNLRGAVAQSPSAEAAAAAAGGHASPISKGGRRVGSVGSPARGRKVVPGPAAAETPPAVSAVGARLERGASPRRAHTPQAPSFVPRAQMLKERRRDEAQKAAEGNVFGPAPRQREKLNAAEQQQVVDRLYTRRVAKVEPVQRAASPPRWHR